MPLLCAPLRGPAASFALKSGREHLAEHAPRIRDVLEVGVLRPKERLKPVDDCRPAGGVVEPGIPLRQEAQERTLLSCGLGGVEGPQRLLGVGALDPRGLKLCSVLEVRLPGASEPDIRLLCRPA